MAFSVAPDCRTEEPFPHLSRIKMPDTREQQSARAIQRNGSWRATTRYGDEDGISRPVDRFGATKGQAEDALRRTLADRKHAQGKLITRETTLTELAELWLAEKAVQDGITPQSLDLYRREIEVSTDKRAKPDAIKIKSSLGRLLVWEPSTTRLDPTSSASRSTVIGRRHGASASSCQK
ncbi:hypothetical protein ACSVDM_05995 [Nocardia sp. JW2]|uniref:hypothetical protein n=1 Tax=Nocardia sp. JW2 TaxID=3450738 RepID=UPI003F4360C2